MYRGLPSALEVFFINDMRYINPRFTYLLTYLLTRPKTVTHPSTNRARRNVTSFIRGTTLSITPRLPGTRPNANPTLVRKANPVTINPNPNQGADARGQMSGHDLTRSRIPVEQRE